MAETNAENARLSPQRPLGTLGDLGKRVRAFECALSSRTSSLVHGVRWAEVFFFGTDCCSGKGSRLRATPVARVDAREQKRPASGVQHGAVEFSRNWVSPSLPLRDVVRLPGGHHSTPGRWT